MVRQRCTLPSASPGDSPVPLAQVAIEFPAQGIRINAWGAVCDGKTSALNPKTRSRYPSIRPHLTSGSQHPLAADHIRPLDILKLTRYPSLINVKDVREFSCEHCYT